MEVQLIVTSKTSNEVTEASFAVEDKVTIGRHLGSPVLIQGEGLSRYHFSLCSKEGVLEIEDLSSNGTWLNGKLLKAHLSTKVKSGDAIDVPGHHMQVIFTSRQRGEATYVAGASKELLTEPKSGWPRPLIAVLTFFDGLEVMLMVLATLTFALIFFYFTR